MTLTVAYDAAKTAADNTSIAAIKAKTDTLSNGATLTEIEASTVLTNIKNFAQIASQNTQT